MIELMSQCFPLICAMIGMLLGAWLLVIGYKLGFKASYEIRECKINDDTEGRGIFPSGDLKEYDEIIAEMKKADEDDDEDED